jgi:shikimate dehydrogenase
VTRDGFRLGIIGRPATHSLSPAIHKAALAAAGLTGTYTPWDLRPDEARNRLREIREGEFDGCNVTMPYKRLAYEFVDVRSELARRTGAVNTVTRSGARLVGHNTDVAGVTGAWTHRCLPVDGPVLLLGAGGAAAAAAVALSGRDLVVSARSQENARRLLTMTAVNGRTVSWGSAVEGVVVNATPVGMNGENHVAAVVDAATGWFEMVYARGETPAEIQCERARKPVASGTDMLIHQAVAAFELWTGRVPSIDVMIKAVQAEEQRRRDPQ